LPFFFCHCIVCPSIYGFWLPLWYLQASLCPFALFILSLYCLSFFYLQLLINNDKLKRAKGQKEAWRYQRGNQKP
jgi:hypothetical protein